MSTVDELNFEIIEAAIRDAIESAVPDFKTVDTFSGQPLEALEGKSVGLPGAFVLFDGETLLPAGGPNHGHAAKFVVVVAAESFRGGDDVRTGDLGAYTLTLEVQKALTNSRLGLAIDRLRPVSVDPIHATPTLAVYALEFETAFDTTFGNW